MHRARIAGNFRTRHPQQRPDHIGVTLFDGEVPRGLDLPHDSAPTVVQLPIFEPPRVLMGQSKISGINCCGMETIHFGADLEKTVKDHGGTGFRQTDNIEWQDFVRMLAKIGYSFIVGLFGITPLEKVHVLSIIQGNTNDAGNWIGSRQYDTESERRGALNGLSHIIYESVGELIQRFLVARIKLFASSSATGYEVIVRAAPDGAADLARYASEYQTQISGLKHRNRGPRHVATKMGSAAMADSLKQFVSCGKCGGDLDEPVDTPAAVRSRCPLCGSTARAFGINIKNSNSDGRLTGLSVKVKRGHSDFCFC